MFSFCVQFFRTSKQQGQPRTHQLAHHFCYQRSLQCCRMRPLLCTAAAAAAAETASDRSSIQVYDIVLNCEYNTNHA
jgi:hypothetical protein